MKTTIITVLILIVGTFYILTIRDGHDWGDDFSMYIHHAKNIVEGIRYDRVGYIPNPYYPSYSPKAYPPVFPLALAPVYLWFGMNLTAMKIEIVVFFMSFLFIFFFAFRNDLPFPCLVAAVGIIGFTPYLWEFKDQILSDLPFLVFLFAGLYLITRAYRPGQSKRERVLHAVAIVFLTYLSYGTRTVGIVLIPCLLLYELIRTRRLSRFVMFTTLGSVSLILSQELFVSGSHSSFSVLGSNLPALFSNASAYGRTLFLVWNSGYSDGFGLLLVIGLCALALWGYWCRIKDGITSFEVFAPLYVGSLMVWPYLQGRYVIPLIPLIILYAFAGIGGLPLKRRWLERTAVVVLVLVILLSYSGQYSRANYGPLREGIGRESSAQMFNFIVSNTDPEDTFICRRPRALALFTGRSAAAYRPGQDGGELWGFVRAIGAKYLVIGPFDSADIVTFIAQHRNNLEVIYTNADFKIYSISPSDQAIRVNQSNPRHPRSMLLRFD